MGRGPRHHLLRHRDRRRDPGRTQLSRRRTMTFFPNGAWFVPAELRIPTDVAMRDLGRELAGRLRAGDLVILTGPLGAGKTTLVQGIGEGLRVRGPVTSPTFVIARVHPVVAGPG